MPYSSPETTCLEFSFLGSGTISPSLCIVLSIIMTMRHLIAVDPSLTCSGWALFRLPSGTLLGVGKVKGPKPGPSMGIRLRDLQTSISRLLDDLTLKENDVLICEAPTTVRDPRAAFLVEQVRCMFETLARERGLSVPGRINPRSVHVELLGLKGRQLSRDIVKAMSVRTVHQLHREDLERLGFGCALDHLEKNQDIVDALLIGRLGISRIDSAFRGGHTLDDYFEQLTGREMARRPKAVSAR